MLLFQPCILPVHLTITFFSFYTPLQAFVNYQTQMVDCKYLGGLLFSEPEISSPLCESICGYRVIQFKVKVTQDSLKGGECGSAIRRYCVMAMGDVLLTSEWTCLMLLLGVANAQ